MFSLTFNSWSLLFIALGLVPNPLATVFLFIPALIKDSSSLSRSSVHGVRFPIPLTQPHEVVVPSFILAVLTIVSFPHSHLHNHSFILLSSFLASATTVNLPHFLPVKSCKNRRLSLPQYGQNDVLSSVNLRSQLLHITSIFPPP